MLTESKSKQVQKIESLIAETRARSFHGRLYYEAYTNSKVLSIGHINQIAKFSPYLTNLELRDLTMNEDVLIGLLKFLNECSELRCLVFSDVKHEKLTYDLSNCHFELGILDSVYIID